MNPDSDESDIDCLGAYQPSDAARILDAFGQAGIEFHAEFVTDEPSVELEGDSPETKVFIGVVPRQHEEACKILAELFGGDFLDES